MGVPKRLTEMQKRFAEYLVFGGPRRSCVNKTEAAELAGYSVKRCQDIEGIRTYLTQDNHHLWLNI